MTTSREGGRSAPGAAWADATPCPLPERPHNKRARGALLKPRLPLASYRLQLTREFPLGRAAELVDYFQALGITHLYASPVTTAREGSVHGYDVIDHEQINPELGGEPALAQLAERLRAAEMGLVVDVVPNHMCIAGSENRWWMDVLENGPSSPYADFFDVDWHPPKDDLTNKTLLPVLGDQYGRVLENGEIQIVIDGGAFYAQYHQTRFPITPRSQQRILVPAVEDLSARLGREHPSVEELESILTASRHLPPRSESDPEKIRERHREKEIIKRRLGALCESDAEARGAIERSLTAINGRRGEARSFDHLEELLSEQAYRLSYWRVASDEINYRRFFDINELAAIRVEDEVVFKAVHDKIFDLVRKGWVDGLRIDHVDGLYDPEKYLRRLQDGLRAARGDRAKEPFFVVVEKILGAEEHMPPAWACAGTTGYDFLNQVNGVLFDAGNADAYRRLYHRFAGQSGRVDDMFYESKKLVLDVAMSSELTVLARFLDRISEQHRHSRDFTLNSLHAALREVIACFPVYRSYICEHNPRGNDEDRKHVVAAVRCARRRNPAVSPSIYEFIGAVLLGDDPPGLDERDLGMRRLFALRVQQLTGPVTAKGVEDTTFYRYYPIASLAEVGGDPAVAGISLNRFHRHNLERRERWPHTLNATSTHDTKRSEDVRARITTLSEIPGAFYRAVVKWREANENLRPVVDGVTVPDKNEEYLLYQTIVGVWPLRAPDDAGHAELIRRVEEYMIKALREAKVHSSWVNVDEGYEQAMRDFVRAILGPGSTNRFLRHLVKFQARVARAGALTSLAQLVIKLASPGIPDFYQGTELWDLSLVDPDNRRPVDWERRIAGLAAIRPREGEDMVTLVEGLIRRWEDGDIKLHVTRAGLLFRKSNPELFLEGGYHPLKAAGQRGEQVVAFARVRGDDACVALTGRHFLSLGGSAGRWPAGPEVWSSTAVQLRDAVPGQAFRDALTGRNHRVADTPSGRMLPLGDIFAVLPMALLERIP